MWNEDVRGDNGGATYSGYTVFAGETIYAPKDYWDVGYKVGCLSLEMCVIKMYITGMLGSTRHCSFGTVKGSIPAGAFVFFLCFGTDFNESSLYNEDVKFEAIFKTQHLVQVVKRQPHFG